MNTLKDLNTLNKNRSYLAYFIVIISFSFSIFIYISSEKKVQLARQKAFILKSDGDIFVGEISELRENREIEVKHHIKMLHQSLFFLNPNENHIHKQIQETAYYLGDNSIIEFDKRRANKNFYNDLISTGSTLQFKIDSIKTNMNQYPYRAICWGRQRIVREKEIIYHNVITNNILTNTIRSEENPHGLSINFKIIDYSETTRKER